MPADEVRLPLTAVPRPARSFGRSVLRLRLARGLTRTALAEAAGMGEATIRRLESGKAGCTLDTAWPIAEALEAELGAMIRGELDRYLPAREQPQRLSERNWLSSMPESPPVTALLAAALGMLTVDAACYGLSRLARLWIARDIARWCLLCAAVNALSGILATVRGFGLEYAAGGGIGALAVLALWWVVREPRRLRALRDALVWRASDVAVPHPAPGRGGAR